MKGRPSFWQIAIDTGGTFTDCIGIAPDGRWRTVKLPSNGVVRGAADSWIGERSLLVRDRRECDSFWNGCGLVLGNAPDPFFEARVTGFQQERGLFTLDRDIPLPFRRQGISVRLITGMPAPVAGIHQLVDVPLISPLPWCSVHLGTTRGTNALLTRSGARTALVTTRGLGDILSIGDQTRPDLFALTVRKPLPLAECSLEITGRVLADGTVERGLDEAEVLRGMKRLRESGIHSVAICLMHGFRFPDQERRLEELARQAGFSEVCVSSQVAPLIRFLERAETTVLDACLNPVLREWLQEIMQRIGPDSRLRMMTSSGALVHGRRFSGKDSLLSGPAGGVIGAAWVARQAGFDKAIALDMGGTSTDVSRFDGDFEMEFESRKAGVRVLVPVLAIETVAAGGGSICRFDGSRLVVGPESAGADPGPACYGADGPFTVTDANLLLGRIRGADFPFPLDEAASRQRAEELCETIGKAGFHWSVEELARGCVQIANHHMAEAIRAISVAKGFDPSGYPLVAFGGAAAQHACELADMLEMKSIVVHPLASLLSAAGMHLADQASHQARSILRPLDRDPRALVEPVFDEMEQAARKELAADVSGYEAGQVLIRRSVELRYQGTMATEAIDYETASGPELQRLFETRHERQYGYIQNRPIEIVNARLSAVFPGNHLASRFQPDGIQSPLASPANSAPESGIFSPGPEASSLSELWPGTVLHGPVIIADAATTTVVEAGWRCTIGDDRSLLLERMQRHLDSVEKQPGSSNLHPVMLEIFNQLFTSIATQMGKVLQRTSSSVNVKERLDFSCALFTRDADLIVNAPHIPVHLGAMSETVRSTISRNPSIVPGDVFVTNNPWSGGSHLPDVTVLTPVFMAKDPTPAFWIASRAHHAEIGGIAPGSMPAHARTLGEEGVLIDNFRLIHQRQSRFDELRKILTTGPAPSRTPDENLRDLQAQVAANRCGELALRRLVDQYSLPVVEAYMHQIRAASARKVREVLARVLPAGTLMFDDAMDSGQRIRVTVTKSSDGMVIDFAGTDPVGENNLNANPAIVRAAVLYCLKLLVGEDVPLNDGMLQPVTIRIPGCFLNAGAREPLSASPPVVGGNVETSQRVVDVILGALGLAAASQGTMNNWLIGNDRFGYYETVGGGSGATAAGPGASAVHCHMSNTRLTDPEVLETRYPVILRECSIRRGSGGAGRHRGGDGMIRHIEFRAPLVLSLLTSRRTQGPRGMECGRDGKPGVNLFFKADGTAQALPWRCEVQVQPGDSLRLETPGGGGFGVRESPE